MSESKVSLQEASDKGVGRRELILRSAALFGASALLTQELSAQTAPTDLTLLNYALTLENLEATFYAQGLSQFSSADFGNSTFIQNFGSIIGGDVYAYLSIIRDHEAQHVRTLQSMITALGGTPAKPCTYNFGYKTADDFVTTAALLENTGVMAYDGAISQISSASLKTAAATIATVEARHASYLNILTGAAPFANSFDTAATSAQILAAAGKYITAC
ncbi:MAG TPA: ferritin-like domain-containing protein [Bryobacteraceae bacterium]